MSTGDHQESRYIIDNAPLSFTTHKHTNPRGTNRKNGHKCLHLVRYSIHQRPAPPIKKKMAAQKPYGSSLRVRLLKTAAMPLPLCVILQAPRQFIALHNSSSENSIQIEVIFNQKLREHNPFESHSKMTELA